MRPAPRRCLLAWRVGLLGSYLSICQNCASVLSSLCCSAASASVLLASTPPPQHNNSFVSPGRLGSACPALQWLH